MSLNSLASSQAKYEVQRQRGSRAMRGAGGADTAQPEDLQNPLSALVEYLPAETIVLYTAAISALPSLQSIDVRSTHLYFGFAIATPVLYLLIYGGKRRASGLPPFPAAAREWPVWPMVAATAAFLAWALAVPGSPYLSTPDGRVLSGLMAVTASVLLGVIGRLVGTSGSAEAVMPQQFDPVASRAAVETAGPCRLCTCSGFQADPKDATICIAPRPPQGRCQHSYLNHPPAAADRGIRAMDGVCRLYKDGREQYTIQQPESACKWNCDNQNRSDPTGGWTYTWNPIA